MATMNVKPNLIYNVKISKLKINGAICQSKTRREIETPYKNKFMWQIIKLSFFHEN